MLRFFGAIHIEYAKETRGLETGFYSNKLVGVVSFIDLENRYMIIEGRDRSIPEKYKIRIFIEKNSVIRKLALGKGGNEIIFPASLEEVLPGKILILKTIIDNDGYIKVNSVTYIDIPPPTTLMPHV